jgi:hypothetical protein
MCTFESTLGLHLDVLGLQHELCVLYHLQWEGVYRERNQIYLFQSMCIVVRRTIVLSTVSKTRSQSQSTRCIHTPEYTRSQGRRSVWYHHPKLFWPPATPTHFPHHSFMALPGTRVLFPRLPFPNVIKTLARYISP